MLRASGYFKQQNALDSDIVRIKREKHDAEADRQTQQNNTIVVCMNQASNNMSTTEMLASLTGVAGHFDDLDDLSDHSEDEFPWDFEDDPFLRSNLVNGTTKSSEPDLPGGQPQLVTKKVIKGKKTMSGRNKRVRSKRGAVAWMET